MDHDLRVPLYDIEVKAEPKVFCVTGASGYIGGEIVRRLLAAGHTVHGTVRGEPSESRFDGLRELDQGLQRLKLFKATLSEIGSFDEAIQGCDVVIHVASPTTVKVQAKQAHEHIINPAVDGMKNVIRAVERSGSVDTVVYTSSMSAVFGDNWERGKDHTYSESDWDQVASATRFPYAYSKTLAEKKAWELYESQQERSVEKRWRLVTILPAFVLGPPAFPVQSELVEFACMLLQGKIWPFMPNYEFPYVDLADVAAAHVLVALEKKTQGRFMVAAGSTSQGFLPFVQSVRGDFKNYRFPVSSAPKWLLWIISKFSATIPWDVVVMTLDKPMKFDASRISMETEFTYHDPRKGLIDLLNRVLELGMAPRIT